MSERKILVIDDEDGIQEMVRDVLELANYEVIQAKDGDEGLEKVYSESPDLVLLDVSMPKMDGYEVVRAIRKDMLTQNIPVIMLSVRGAEGDEVKGLNLGVDDYIIKPFNTLLLLARVRAVLSRTRRSTGINPLTMLPGNAAIIHEVEARILRGKPFAVLYIDISNFKSYNDCYGFQNGDNVIKACAGIILREVRLNGTDNDFVGHIGGDDFIATTSKDKAEQVCKKIIEIFDRVAPQYYRDEDRKKGYIVTEDRQGKLHQFPIMTLSIGVVIDEQNKYKHMAEISTVGTELKNLAKKSKAHYVINRRYIDKK